MRYAGNQPKTESKFTG